jgi:hypothetical protein
VTPTFARLCLAAVVALGLLARPHAQTARRVWVVQPPDAIVSYDTATFERLDTVKLPPRAVAHPNDLRVSASGRMVLVPPTEWAGDEDRAKSRIWIWDGRSGTELPLGDERIGEIPSNAKISVERVRTLFLSPSADSLVWLENRFEKQVEGVVERSVRVSARVWQSDLHGEHARPIAGVPVSAACACGTGVCSETCPQWDLWAPDGLVDAFFLLTSVVPGQLGSTTIATRVYRRSGSAWRWSRLAQPVERPLAASRDAALLVAAVPDGGCCGWENDSNDQLLLLRDGKTRVVYDERERYDNADYDVSFYPANARLAPGFGALAYTVASTAEPSGTGEIRLTTDGKPNAAELARVRKAALDLPAVEVILLDAKAPKPVGIPHAMLVGWLDDRRLLVVRNDRVVVCATDGRLLQETSITVRGAADAFLR